MSANMNDNQENKKQSLSDLANTDTSMDQRIYKAAYDSFDRYFTNTLLNGMYFARCQAYSYEQGSCSYGP